MKGFIKEWWPYVTMFVMMVVGNYLNAISNNGSSWVWTLNGALLSTTIWHALESVIAYRASRHRL